MCDMRMAHFMSFTMCVILICMYMCCLHIGKLYDEMHYVTFSASDIGCDPSHDFVMYMRTPI